MKIALKVVICCLCRVFVFVLKRVGPPKFRAGDGRWVEGKSSQRGDLNESKPSEAKNNLYWFWQSLPKGGQKQDLNEPRPRIAKTNLYLFFGDCFRGAFNREDLRNYIKKSPLSQNEVSYTKTVFKKSTNQVDTQVQKQTSNVD
ncbi:hypothetical protein QQ020_24810 [Fulvivirgaceae bacterium BMA12]|uniref:Uncharacterized protein n=1 Tax=Agaribacillus aureus TaxID=3051825 RepID=A0ABT8LC14_9BACT|nr:hypothetical protein [Fulvivirgaceae bacterium BMA12]